MARDTRKTVTIDPNTYLGRDTLIVALINGATKAGVQKDRRKEADRKACRGRYRGED